MQQMILKVILASTLVASAFGVMAAEETSTVTRMQQQATETLTQAGEAASRAAEQVSAAANRAAEQAKVKYEEAALAIEKHKKAQEARDGILGWIYVLAELMAFKAFHWVAFMLMIAGVVSWSGQVIIAKLVVGASSATFDFRETISDIVVLAISLIGLVLTTQAAASSGFTASTVGVLSATAVGAILGIVLYFWGQALELEAAKK